MSAKITDKFNIRTNELLCANVTPMEDSFDFGLFFNSTETRSLEYNKLFKERAIEYSILVDFKNEESNLKKINLKSNQDNLSLKSKKYEILHIDDIFNYQDNLNKIVTSIPKNLFKLNARFFIDITGAPLIYSVALIRYFKLSFPSPILYLLNVSSDYNSKENPQFSEGIRENIFIPGYYGKPNHSKPKLYVFLLGYEGERSLNILKTNDPDFVEVIIPAPGYEEGNPQKTVDKNKEFLKEIGFIDKELVIENGFTDKIIKVPIGNPEEVANTVLSLYEKYSKIADVRLVLPSCPKPHAIGAGLAAIAEENISIMYQTPKEYKMEDYAAGEKMWIYVIK